MPAYDRTRLIHGAIHTLTEVMGHEMIIASIAILLILMHVRSVFVICITLPLAVLFSFLMMWVLRRLGIIDIQANIMSLAGITISIGILVDQAIVMTENATHHLKEHFGDQQGHRRHPRTGDRALPHGRPADLLLGADHAAVVRSGVHAQRPRRQAVSSAGLHQELRHDRRGADFGHAGAGADSDVHPRPPAERRRKLDRPQLHQYLQAAAHLGLAAAEPGDVDVRGAADPGGRACFRLQAIIGPGSLAKRPGRSTFLVVFALVTVADRDFHARTALAGVVAGDAWC